MVQVDTGRITLQLLSLDYSKSLLHYRLRNREHLAPWEPSGDGKPYVLRLLDAAEGVSKEVR